MERGGPLWIMVLLSINFYLNYFGKHMKMLCFKFNQNCRINEEFDFFEEEGGRSGLWEGKGGFYS